MRGALLVLMLVLLPSGARAAACCMSATSFGVGRLLVWEDFAVGVQLGHSRIVGQYDPQRAYRATGTAFQDGITRLEPWAIVRLGERVQVQARVPVLVNDREAGTTSQVVGGLGDVGAGVRLEAISLGEFERLPSLGFTLGVLAPTGRRAEQGFAPLGAGATGRGAWGASLALESEYTWLPWYVRVDAGVSVFAPFVRAADCALRPGAHAAKLDRSSRHAGVAHEERRRDRARLLERRLPLRSPLSGPGRRAS